MNPRRGAGVFPTDSYRDRMARARARLAERGLSALLVFAPESHYYLFGYDGGGYVFFQCLYLGADEKLFLLTREPDLRQAQHTSILTDIQIWVDGANVNPALQLKNILEKNGCKGKSIGVEYDSYGLTAKNGKLLDSALDGFCRLFDASNLVNRLRLVKSFEELKYVKKAADLADNALD